MSFTAIKTSLEAREILRDQLIFGRCSPADTRFEILRAVVWGMAAPAGKAHVNRVLSTAFSTWRLLSERAAAPDEELRSDLRDALSCLEDAGDLFETRGGYWSPATPRVVALPEPAGSHLLVGGVPSRSLQIQTNALQYHGPYRLLIDLPANSSVDFLRKEDFSSWAKRPDVDLAVWADDLLKSLERTPYTPDCQEQFDFYRPEKCRAGTPQFKRWLPSAGEVTGTLLARRIRIYGAREYRLVDSRAGQIVAARELHDVDVRRLMYALDLEARNPVSVRQKCTREETQWIFSSELPRAEQRTFAAFGNLTIPNDRRFERHWTFVRNENTALDMVRSLGIAVAGPSKENDR